MTEKKSFKTNIVFVKLIFDESRNTALSILYKNPDDSLKEHLSLGHRHSDIPIQLDATRKSFIEWDERTGKALEININLLDTPIH